MPQIGDLFAKLAQGQQLTSGEIEQLRLGMNQQQGITSQMSALLTLDGNLDPNIFSHHSRGFSILPHESAGMTTYDKTQPIEDLTWTTLTYTDHADLDELNTRSSWSEGVKRDIATGKFYLTSIPGQTIWLFECKVNWASEPTLATVTLYEEGSTLGNYFAIDDANSMGFKIQKGIKMVRAYKAANSYSLRVHQVSGGTINVTGAKFAVARLR